MSIALFSLCSSLHSEARSDESREAFITGIEAAIGEKFIFCGSDFSTYGTHGTEVIYIRTGGTEGLFRQLSLKGDVRLLTSGESNSLAASMEILAYLRANGRRGVILHGSPEEIAEGIRAGIGTGDSSPFIRPLSPIDLGGLRLGVIGKPSDWLIGSGVDYASAKRRFNLELVDIPMEELLTEIRRFDGDLRSFRGSEAIYDALLSLISAHGLGGLALRCFDLLDSVHNTGCLALARLNAEGIPSSCEGDIPALISMAYLQKTRGCPGFQCNLSRINGDRLLFAHCTAPLNMLTGFSYATHFESGIGTAIKGEVKLGKAEIFKISPDLESCVSIPCEIIGNEALPRLCRTQIVVNAPGAAEYFLRSPLANHHIVSF